MLDLITLTYGRARWSGLLNQLFANYQEWQSPQNIPVPENSLAESIHQLGTVTIQGNQEGETVSLGVIEIVASDAVALLRNRVGIRNLAARLLAPGTADGLLVATTQPGNDAWRFTFIHREARFNEEGDYERVETPTRRFTYVLGPNESCKTPDSRFQLLARHRGDTSITNILDAFSVEKLSDEFFDMYKQHYQRFCNHLIEHTDAPHLLGVDINGLAGRERDRALKPIRDFAKKLLGRLVFLHFIQKKRWLGCPPLVTELANLPQESMPWTDGSPEFLRELFNTTPPAERPTFHSSRLVPLFYQTLNNPDREGLIFPITGTRVPYLNGGLFEPDFEGVELVDFPAPLFEALLEFFRQYHFTIDENDPEDHEIGIDPEMLGRIFENLLEDNKDKGAYYTPKPVVQYMCQQSLILALVGRFAGDEEAPAEIERLIRYKEPIDPRQNTWRARHATALSDNLDDLRVCDPAIGSGAFPIGLLQEIYWTKLTLNPSLDRAHAKRDIIQHCIHGVDLDAGAVEIARLRFWLALIVDEDVPKPLPNLDYQIMQGNSLLESFEGERLDQLAEPVFFTGRQRLGSNEMELDLGTNASPGEFVIGIQTQIGNQICQLREEYYACHDPARKADLRVQIDTVVLQAIDARLTQRRQELECALTNYDNELARKLRLTPNYEPTRRESLLREKMQSELDALIEKSTRLRHLLDNPRTERPFFLWHLWFRQILAESPQGRGGFDIVIGNPPYVRADNRDFLSQRAAILAEKNGSDPAFVTLWEKWDLFMPFIELGHTLLCPGGVESMIVSDAYCHSKYAIKSQEWFLQNAVVLRLDFLGKLQIFDAGVKNMIFFYSRGNGGHNIPERRLHTESFGNVTLLPSEPQELANHRLFFPESISVEVGNFTIDTVPLEQICYISVGMVAHAHEKIARGDFELRDLVSSVRDATHPKPFVEAKHLGRWHAQTHRWFEWGTRRSPAMLRRQTFTELYEASEKLISVDMAAGVDSLTVVYDDAQLFHNHSAWSFVPWHYLNGVRNRSLKKSARYPDEANPGERLPNRRALENLSSQFDAKYLVAVMNSKVARYYLGLPE